jgi:uncharacterized protein (TIGR00255 family)
MRSMTGYGTAEGESERFRVAATLRSVNHRYLDLVLRLKDEVRPQEPALRELLGERLFRGRVELSVDLQARAVSSRPPEVDRGLLEGLHGLFESLENDGLIAGQLTPGDLLRIPQVLSLADASLPWEETDDELLFRVVGEALDQLVAARATEGAKVHAVLEEKLDGLGAVVDELVALAPEALGAAAADLERRLEALLAGPAAAESGTGVDPVRLAQEVALLADKSDVSEELDRLGAHLEHFREVLGDEGSIGKRLDFLAQEIFRELNTLGSKSRHPEMAKKMLDAKVLAEQIREQVQNVE